jgi:hypothetical protein
LVHATSIMNALGIAVTSGRFAAASAWAPLIASTERSIASARTDPIAKPKASPHRPVEQRGCREICLSDVAANLVIHSQFRAQPVRQAAAATETLKLVAVKQIVKQMVKQKTECGSGDENDVETRVSTSLFSCVP